MRKTLKLALVPVAALSLFLVTASPASAGSLELYVTRCVCERGDGSGEFLDYAEGPRGNMNDDFFYVHDYCPDGEGVKIWVQLDGRYIGSKHNGSGYAAPPVYWDPVQITGSHDLGMKVCLSNGDDDPTPFDCIEHTWLETN